MKLTAMHGSAVAFCLTLWFVLTGARSAAGQWPQWGGPNRNFTVDASGLADKWPDEGPKRIWHRELGDGYASIVYDDGVLYTMYRKTPTAESETTVALDARTGQTRWEHSIPSALREPLEDYGYSPNSTPLVVGEHLYTIGANAVMHCFRKDDGTVLWQHDLAKEFGAPFPGDFGYAYSPIAYKDLVVVPVGEPRAGQPGNPAGTRGAPPATAGAPDGQALVAFDQRSGNVVWKRHHFEIGQSSPTLIRYDGRAFIVLVTSGDLLGIDPADGNIVWRYHFPRGGGDIMTPIWIEPDMLFCSSGGERAGSRMIRLAKKDGQIVAEEAWQTPKARFIQANPVLVNGVIVGSSGIAPSAVLIGLDARTGERLWAQRASEQAAYVHAGGKIIFLDWNGQLALATATKDGLTIHSQFKATERYAMTVPTLVGATLYVRDRKHIMAFDLG